MPLELTNCAQNDGLQFLLDKASTRNETPFVIAQRLLILNFAAIHTSSTVSTFTITFALLRALHAQVELSPRWERLRPSRTHSTTSRRSLSSSHSLGRRSRHASQLTAGRVPRWATCGSSTASSARACASTASPYVSTAPLSSPPPLPLSVPPWHLHARADLELWARVNRNRNRNRNRRTQCRWAG